MNQPVGNGSAISRRDLLQRPILALAGAAGLALLGCDAPRAPAGENSPAASGIRVSDPTGPLNPADFLGREILGTPTNRSVGLTVVPARSLDLAIEYGTRPGSYSARMAIPSAPDRQPVAAVLGNLEPGTRHYYRLRAGDRAGEERTFVTQRGAGQTFTFAIQGDSHPERLKRQFDPDLYVRALQNVRAAQPDFFLTIGDDFSVDTLRTVNNETVREVYLSQRRYLSALDAPIFLLNGNHEQASLVNLDGTPNNVAVWAQNHRNRYFALPAPDVFYTGNREPVEHIGLLRDYFAFTWGDALFVVIDPYWHSLVTVDNEFEAGNNARKNRDLWDVTLGDPQYRWLKQTLETSQARYKFVFSHHVMGTGRGGIELARSFEWGDTNGLKVRRPGWERTIHGLMAANGVSIFFQGHDHIYVKQELDGLIYQTLPEPADPNYSWFNADAYRSGTKLPNSGHLRVTVAPENTLVEYVLSVLPHDETNDRKNGQVAHSYRVAPRAGRTS